MWAWWFYSAFGSTEAVAVVPSEGWQAENSTRVWTSEMAQRTWKENGDCE